MEKKSLFKLVRFTLICLLVLGLNEVGFSQDCLGVGGSGITGGPISTNNGLRCANLDAVGGPGTGATINITAGNVEPGDFVSFEVNWDDGTITPVTFANIIPGPGPGVTWQLEVTHYFPITGPDVKCEYVPRVSLFINGILCTNSFGTPPRFTRWNFDNENSGELRLTETATDVNTYRVCRGTETMVTFTDRSTLNCVPPEYNLPNPINNFQRWRRFTYGTLNTITSATGVEVGGTIETYPFAGAVVTDGPPSQNPLPPTVTLPITIPADAQVGQEFEITMEYWNTCNPFPGTPVRETARIIVVDQPPPPTPNNNIVCNASPLPDFSISIPAPFPANSIVTWFQDNANSPGAVIPSSTTSTLPASAIGVNNTIAGTYRVWASYFGVNNPQGISCESARIPVTLTIRENLPIIPAPFPGYSNQICRDDPMTITLPNPATESFGGATEYVWSVTGGGGVTFVPTANSATFNFTGVTFGGASFVDRNIRIVRRYTSNPQCTSPNRNLTVRIFAPSIGGSLSAVPDICETSPVGTINLTGERGTVQRWEVSFNGGPFLPNAGLGTGNSISPGIVVPGVYQYRAIVGNGTCAEAPSTIEELEVFENPDAATVGVRQEFCKASLDSNPLGGNAPSAGTGVWSVFSRPATSTATAANFADATQGNTIFTGDVFGVYVLRWTIESGICISTADIEVDFGTLPGPQEAGTAGPFCDLTGALNAAAPPTVGIGRWSLAPVAQPGTAIFADDLDRNSDVTVSDYGTYTFRWTVTSGICAPEHDDVVVRFTQPATATVPTDFTICVDQILLAPIPLTGNNLVGGGATFGRWEIVTGSGTIQSTGGPLGLPVSNATLFLDRYVPAAGETSVEVRMVAQHPDLAACPNVNSTPMTITIDRRPGAAAAGTDFEICIGDVANLNATPATNGGVGTWSPTAGVDDVNDPTTTVTGLTANTTFTWTVRSQNDGLPGACTFTSDEVLVTVNPLPDALDNIRPICETNPGTAIALAVDLTSFNDDVTGITNSTDRTVEWYSDAARTTLVTLPVDVTNTQIFFTTVTNTITNCEADGFATFTVNPLPIANDLFPEICEDVPVGSNNVDDLDLTFYDDQVYGVGQIDRVVDWFTDATYTTPVPDPTNVDGVGNNDQFFARVRNTITDCENDATLTFTINPRPGANPIIGPTTVCADPDAIVLYQVTTINPGSTYVWNVPEGAGEFELYAGGTTNDFFAVLKFPNVVTPGLDISVTEFSIDGCEGVTEILNVTVESSPPVITIAGPFSVCANETGVVYSVGNLPNTTFAWTVPVGASIIGGQGTNSITVNFGALSGNVSVLPTTSTGCPGNSDTDFVTVTPRPILDPLLNATNCSNELAGIIFDVAVGSEPATSYNITAVNVDAGLFPVTGPTSGTGLAANAIFNDEFENLTGGPLNVRYTVVPVSAEGCEGVPRTVTLTVRPEPTLDPGLGVTICSQQPTGIILKVATGSFPADQFEIVSITDNGLTASDGNPVIGIFGPTEIADDAWINTTTAPVTVTYTIRPINSSTGCIGDPPQPLSIVINPEPVANPDAETICSGFSPTLTLTSSLPNSTFTWTVKSVMGLANGASNGTGNTITDVLVNNSGAVGTVTYEVIATGPVGMGACSSAPVDVVITVEPAPAVTNITQTVCSDAAGGSTSVTDLVALQPSINADATLTFTWFQDAALTTPIPPTDVNAYPIANGIPVFAQVSNVTCNSVASVTFTVNPLPSVVATASQFNGFEITCNGANNGRITAVASQGTPPYLYSIDGGANFFPTATFNSLSPHPGYVITVRDSRGCTVDSAPIPIVEPTLLEINSTVIVAPACRNTASGSVQVVASGGITGTYTYSINGSPFQATDLFSNLLAGSYTLTVRDANNCTANSTVTVVDPPLLDGSVTGQINVDCNGNNTGSVTVEGSGGVAPYTYSRDGVNFQASGTFTALAAGAYTITVRDVNNCITPVAVNITQPGVLVLNLSSKTDVLCNGQSTGALTVVGAGGTAPYEYAIDGTTFQTSGDFTGLAFGPQVLTVRDANLCQATLNVTINQPNPIIGSITSQTNVDCFGNNTGSVTVNGSGGTGTYLFAIDGGGFGGSPTFSGLIAGNYVVTIQDQNNCTADVPVTITEPTVLGGSVVNASNVLCAGGNSGTVEVLGSGGTAPYQYSINGGGLFTANATFTGLTAGLYTVIVRDNNLCTFEIDFEITQPTPLVASISTQAPVDCRNNATGSVTIGASGGTAPYSFSRDGSTFQASGTFTGLAAGNYIIRVRDNNACTQNVNVMITEPPQLVLALQSQTNVDCNGNSTGSITVNATGGVGGYTYSRDGVTFVGSPTFTGFAAGTHTLFTRDANNCQAQVDVVITEPLVLELNVVSTTDVLCNGQSTGSITVQATGGAGSYEYSRDGVNFTPLNVFFGLPAATYTIRVRDGNGCETSQMVPIAQPGALTASAAETENILCYLGSDAELTVSTTGGVAPLSYLLLEDPANASGAITGVFAGIRAGTYTIRVTDANGCSVVTAPITVTEPTQLQITAQITSDYNGFPLSCEGASDARIEAVATGGTGAYTYTLLNPAIVTSNTTGIFDLLPAGNYTVQVEDDNNCLTLSLPVLIFDPFPFSPGFVGFNQAICEGDNPALIQELVPPFGGIANYQYQWQESLDGATFTDVGGAMSATFTPPAALAQTTYYRRVVGSGTCTELESNIVQITVNPLPTVDFTAPAEVCEGDFFLLEFNFTGAPPFRFDYTDGINVFNNNVGNFYTPVPVFNFTNTTTYTLTRVVDINGCVIFPNESVTVNVSRIDPNFTIVSPTAQCSGSTFSFQWTVSPDVEYTWVFGDGTQEVIAPNTLPVGLNTIDHVFTSLVPSTSINFPVILRATNLSNGCGPKQSNQAITVFPSIAVSVFPSDNSICSGETVTFNNLTQGANTHRWFYRELGNVGQELDVRTTQNVNYTFTNNTTQNPITYEVVYVGSNPSGCSGTTTIEIEVYRGITADFDEGVVPPFVGGNSTVTFTNTSVPIDPAAFTYNWNFGVDANPPAQNGVGPFSVDYTSFGNKTIQLEVTNIAAQAAGENCASVQTKTINIILPPLTAQFRAIPLKACFPTTIEVVENLSTGDIYDWQVLDDGGKLVATSNAPFPEFRIVNPGTYDIFLQVTNSITGQHAFAQQNGIEIYDQPQAAFEARPTTFFVPDTELVTFNFTNGASQYDWDFGDGGTSMDFEPKHIYTLEGKYEIVLVAGFDHGNHDVDGDGILDGNIVCYDTARREVVGREGGLTKIPNAFTPNPNGPNGGIPGNGSFNDVFLPITRGVEEFEMQIYDRWGNLIFESRDKNQGWDGYDRNGRLLPSGVYVYKLVLRLSDGQRTTQIGDVTLIR